MPTPKLDANDETRLRAVRLPSRLDDKLQRRAINEDRTVSAVLRDALTAHLKGEPAV